MADNRMWLVHVPTGLAVPLGHHSVSRWYTTIDARLVQRLFDTLATEVGYEGHSTAFTILLENDAPDLEVPRSWAYGEVRADGLRQILWTTPASHQ